MMLLLHVILLGFVSARTNDMITSYISPTYDWDSRSLSVSASCVNIPRNLTLCHSIGYNRMRLPNLLEHDTLFEVSQQAASWVPLLNVRCHTDTQRFLCSLFSPVCLDHPIYPCRSLCEKVKFGCETRMKMYGFPWPEMFSCNRFPEDNDMCITSESDSNSSTEEKCRICEQVNTVENILDHYCQSNFAVRAKLKKIQQQQLKFKKIKLFKANAEVKKDFNTDFFNLNLTEECCTQKLRENKRSYFIMGTYKDKRLNPTFIMPWESFKKSIRMLKTLNCTNPDDITHTVIDSTIAIISPIVTMHTTKTKPKNGTVVSRETRKKKRKQRMNVPTKSSHFFSW
ncbi:hypothetical protein PGB90_008811 [Kerria lacca]